MPKPRAAYKTYQFLINIFELEKRLTGKFLCKSASARGLAWCRNDVVAMVLEKSVLDLAVIWVSHLQRNRTNLFDLGRHFGKTLEKAIFFFLVCATDRPRETALIWSP